MLSVIIVLRLFSYLLSVSSAIFIPVILISLCFFQLFFNCLLLLFSVLFFSCSSFRLISISLFYLKMSTSFMPSSSVPCANLILHLIVVLGDEFHAFDAALGNVLADSAVNVQPVNLRHFTTRRRGLVSSRLRIRLFSCWIPRVAPSHFRFRRCVGLHSTPAVQ